MQMMTILLRTIKEIWPKDCARTEAERGVQHAECHTNPESAIMVYIKDLYAYELPAGIIS